MYIGPDTLLPVASTLAAVVGVTLALGRRLVDAARFVARKLLGRAVVERR